MSHRQIRNNAHLFVSWLTTFLIKISLTTHACNYYRINKLVFCLKKVIVVEKVKQRIKNKIQLITETVVYHFFLK